MGWHLVWRERTPHELACDLGVGPPRMLFANSMLCQLACKEAHFQRQQQALFPAHRAQDLELERLCSGTGVGYQHGRDVITAPELVILVVVISRGISSPLRPQWFS